MKALESRNLKLIPCSDEILSHAIKGDDQLAEFLGIKVTQGWTEFGVEALQYSLEKLRSDESEKGWWTHFPLLKAENILVGSGGFSGRPDVEGIVEIGYEIAPKYSKKGFATEMVQILTNHAFTFECVNIVIAHTMGKQNASSRVLIKNGFEKKLELEDPENGMVWRWELKKPENYS